MSDSSSIRRRKNEHLEICRRQPVEFRRKRTWLEHVELVHQALPAFSAEELDTSVEFFGRKLSAPFLIGAMTGGTPESLSVNRRLAKLAARKGIGLALGSQRAMIADDSLARTYQLRDVAPDILLLGNIGLSQAARMNPNEVAGLVTRIGADGICLHLNAAMEMVQRGGDAAPRRSSAMIGRLCRALGDRLVVKETGCGLSRETASRLARLGVRTLDVAGAGGTSWVRVENLRNGSAALSNGRKAAGLEELEEWGIPTAASLMEVRGLKLRVIASGGLRTGFDLAKSLALGATLGSAALPLLRALDRGGPGAAERWLDFVFDGLRAAMLLTGCRNLEALRAAPVVISGPLLEWANLRGLWRKSGERTK
jgi:isopentenyl-diphosphate delta-isomerase